MGLRRLRRHLRTRVNRGDFPSIGQALAQVTMSEAAAETVPPEFHRPLARVRRILHAVATAPDTPVQKKLTIAGSSRDTCRVSRPYSANISAAAKGSSAAMLMTPPPGFRITMIPAKPTAMAVQRRGPTCSPRIGTDNAVISSGATKKIEYAVDSGSRFNA